MTDRTERSTQSREKTTRRKPWAPPSRLEAPAPKEGYRHRWVRTQLRGEDDSINVHTKLREGWEPVKASDHPEITLVTIENERFKDNIVVGGLMLCKAPHELVEERTAHYKQQSDSQIHSVDNNLMRENDPRMPLFHDRKSKVTFGKGN